MNIKSPSEQWLQFSIFRQRIEAAYVPSFRKAFQAQIHQWDTYGKANGYPQATAMINIIVTGAPLELSLRKLYAECASKWGWKTYRDLPQKGFFQDGIVNRLLASINDYFDKYILNKVVVETTEYTRKWMRQQISAGLENGDGYDVIARSMVDSSVNLMRARRIARTETVRASNYASLDAARLSPLLLKKQWIAAKDNRTRRVPRDTADHLNLDSVTIGLDDWFNEYTTEGIQLLQHPGDINAGAASTINCRCTLAYESSRDNAGRLILNPLNARR